MHRLAVPSFILLTLAFGCERAADETGPETTAIEGEEEAPAATDFIADTIGPEGGTVLTPERFACVDIQPGAVTDPVEVKVQRLTALETLEPEPTAPRMAGTIAGWKPLPPAYDISIRRMDGTLPVFNEGDWTVVICAHIAHGREDDEQEARLARIQDGVVEPLMRVDVPAACQMNPACTPATQAEALAPLRWIDGSPLNPTPAGAAVHAEFKETAGTGGGGCCSPFAVVLPEATATTE